MSLELPSDPHERQSLQYSDGWEEILTAPDAVDYQLWLSGLVELAMGHPDLQGQPLEAVRYAWQRAVEAVADHAMPTQDTLRFTELEIIETALLTMHENIQATGWVIPGILFMVPDLKRGTPEGIDVRSFLAEQ